MDLLITIIIVGILAFIALLFWANSKRCKVSPRQQTEFKNHWAKILQEAQNNAKGAILEADKLLDQGLKIKGYTGSVGEKLKKGGKLFTDLNGIWSAHKLRNQVAHELNVNLSPQQTKAALGQFRRALNDLGFKL